MFIVANVKHFFFSEILHFKEEQLISAYEIYISIEDVYVTTTTNVTWTCTQTVKRSVVTILL